MFKVVINLFWVLLLSSTMLFSQAKVVSLIEMNVVYLEDKSMPTIDDKDVLEIIEEANQELMTKFGVKTLRFNYMGRKDLSTFFKENLKKDRMYYKKLDSQRVKFFSDSIQYKNNKKEIINFLRQWKLWDLKKFFDKDVQKRIRTYNDVLPYLFKKYHEKIRKLEELKLSDGNYLIDRNDNDFNSYINWMAAMHFQHEYDIIICNNFIVYDQFIKPHPHVVLRLAKVGGSSFESPEREVFDGNVCMINLFEMLTDLDYFQKNYKGEDLTRSLWNKIIGRYIMANQLGHMIYLIPDVYNHPKGCLMDSSMENLDYYKGYQYLLRYPIECPKCRPYISAREEHFKGDQLFQEAKYDDAIRSYKVAKKMTPKKLDIDYNSYISLLYYKIAKAYIQLDKKDRAVFYLRKAIKIDKNNIKAKNVLSIIE